MGLGMRYKLGQFIELVDVRNTDLRFGETDVRGVSNYKQFIPTKANVTGAELGKFFIVAPGEFVYNSRTTRMGEKVGLGYNNTDETFVTSWNNTAFRVKRGSEESLLPAFLYMYYNRPEFDRHARFNSWGSSTELFSWDDMCDMYIDLPPLPIQRKYVDVYNAMLANQRAYESGLEDLDTAIAASIEQFKHTAPRVKIGELLEEVDVRNRDGVITNVQGVNINKQFMPSVANLSATDLTKYKVISKDQFAANFMHVMRDGKIPFGLYHKDEPCIISPAYPVFRVKSECVLPEYIMLWINRDESDRYAWFISDSSVRGGMEMSRFYEIEIPLPSLEQQQAAVNFYNARYLIQNNIVRLGNMLKDICPILIKGSIEEVA
jgi:type I restriction enzyme S subunit